MLKQKNYQPRILRPATIFLRKEGKIKIFPGEDKLREFVGSRPIFKKWLKKFSKQKANKELSNFRMKEHGI